MNKILKSNSKNVFKIIAFVCTISLILCVIISGCSSSINERFVKYENASTLVIISYGDNSILGYKKAGGFIEDEILESFEKGTLRAQTLKIYHPYTEGRFVMVNVDTIKSLSRESFNSFYNKMPYNN